ncbi:hypothetical protein HS088_TW03G00249 [Tripterygium wilfordii]|uniref:RIN4 pathogenic type III effector avirulence factor Avr cleavage site domain-containing protein n=1 Tax=Tripterygium wilfordii TaxID=458696 RepID=A0A7J7DU76_TRIWF|nr:hypothetical protein HS088_TW03G00249 [Tripterygium wilfordii]
MEDQKEKNAPWLSVPQFGDWDQKGPLPDYSLDFSKIREMRKQNKRDVSRVSLGNEEELISKPTSTETTTQIDHLHHYNQNHHSPTDMLIWSLITAFPEFNKNRSILSNNLRASRKQFSCVEKAFEPEAKASHCMFTSLLTVTGSHGTQEMLLVINSSEPTTIAAPPDQPLDNSHTTVALLKLPLDYNSSHIHNLRLPITLSEHHRLVVTNNNSTSLPITRLKLHMAYH